MVGKTNCKMSFPKRARNWFLSRMLPSKSSHNSEETNRLEQLFIEPHDNVDEHHSNNSTFALAAKRSLQDRWNTEKGKNILNALSEANFDRDAVKLLVGKIHGKFDLRGAPLKDNDFENLDLTFIDFFAADLKCSNFWGAKLDKSHLSEADIRGATFNFASMEDSFLDNVRYDRKTKFVGVDVRKINFNLAILLQDQVRNQQRIEHLKSRHPIFSAFLWITCDYGQSLFRFLCWVAFIILAFSFAYFLLQVSDKITSFFDAMYFSVVTFATLGFGDITPKTTVGRILVMFEVSLGYVMGGLLIAILARRTIGN